MYVQGSDSFIENSVMFMKKRKFTLNVKCSDVVVELK